MTNEASYVPLGRDNTGAATVLSPFNQQQIWSSYDKREADFDKQLTDSFGRPLNYQGAKVHPNDIPVIRQKVMDYQVAQAKAIQQAKATHTNISPERQQELLAMKMEAQDTISLAQQQLANAEKQQEEIRKNLWLYPQGALQQFDQHFGVPIDRRPFMYTVEKLPTDDLNKWIRDNANGAWKKTDVSYKSADGRSSSRKETVFNEEAARRAYNTLIAPNMNTPKGQQLAAIVQPLIEKVAGPSYATMPPEQRAEISHKVMEDYVVDQMRLAKEGLLETSSSEADPEKVEKIKAIKGGSTTAPLELMIKREYVPYDANGRVLTGNKGEAKGRRLEVVNAIEFPVKGHFNDKIVKENPNQLWKTKSGYVKGTISTLKKYQNYSSGKWDNQWWATVLVDDDGTQKVYEVALNDPENKQAFTKEYNQDPDQVLNKKYPKWKDQMEKFGEVQSPEKLPYWNNYTEGEKKAFMDAYERAKGKTSSTPAPSATKPTSSGTRKRFNPATGKIEDY